MKVKDIQVEGFGVWTGLTVDNLPDGMTVFYGPNEAGKTTLMQFLRAMFYGFTPERRSRYLPPLNGGRPGGAMRVTGPGGGYEIARRAQLNDPGITGQLTVTSGDGVSQGQHRLAMLLGQVDESIFTNVFAIGLRELQELSTLDDTAAADELYKLSSGLDRVSLVDVMRQLRNARGNIVGPSVEQGQMQGIIVRREKLKDELEQLVARGKRWGELAAHRKSYQTEIEELHQRNAQWALESKMLETAMQVREPWMERDRLRESIKLLNARVDLPDDSTEKLKNLNLEIEDRRSKIESVRNQRRSLHARAKDLPVRRNILELASKIEAATEQAPWIASLQKQIVRLESDANKTREQLLEDSKRLGVSDEDQQALLNDKRLTSIPDLSRQAISQLSGPARDTRSHTLLLKQAKAQAENDRKEADRLAAEINELLTTHGFDDLHKALQVKSDLIATLRKAQQIEERLQSLKNHSKDLEGEAVDLATEEAFPMERVFVLGIPFLFGGCMLIAGLFKSTGYGGWLPQDSATGLMMMLIGVVVLFFWWTWRNYTEQSTEGDLTECESQLDTLTRQIKKTESELTEIQRTLPEHTGTIDQQIRELEHDFGQLESLLPVHHNHQAAIQRYQAARKRGVAAAESLKQARTQWRRTLQQLGLAESLSPKSIRIMAEGYDTLLQTRRRLKTQEEELEQRKLELASITQRIEVLQRQVAAALRREQNRSERDPKKSVREESIPAQKRDERRPENRKPDERIQLVRASDVADGNASERLEGCLKKLHELSGVMAEQQQFILQRKSLKEEDEGLSKQQKTLQKSLNKVELARQAYLADLGVEDETQLAAHLETKRQHQKLQTQIDEMEKRVRAIIGGNIPYEAIARLLETSTATELEKRWDGLQQKSQQSEQRISQLHERQGETAQEMKTLAADRRIAEVKLELACLEKQLQACSTHWQTLAATTGMLEKVCEVYETERQPETLREASSFLRQLTEDKYVRVWTPLGKNALRIDNQQGQSLPLEVLSRGTREAVFIALRLSLAAAYARRGVMIPLVLDDVLVNFDTHRARCAAKVLRDFADLGHQVIMFTCHEHIMRMFHDISVQVRVLPNQGQPGEAVVYVPDSELPKPMALIAEPSEIEEPESIPDYDEPEEAELEEIAEPAATVDPEPVVEYMRVSVPPKPRSQPRTRKPTPVADEVPEIDWLWYELDPYQLPQDFDAHISSDDEPSMADPWWRSNSV